MPETETAPEESARTALTREVSNDEVEPLVEELRDLNEAAGEEMAPYEVMLRQMMLTCAAVLTEAGGCASCVAILREAAVAGIEAEDGDEEAVEEDLSTCPTRRGRYRCARPPFHIPSDLHACTDDKMTVYWRDHENKVTLKLSPSEDVLAMLRSVESGSEKG
jgi:hypothetical protein